VPSTLFTTILFTRLRFDPPWSAEWSVFFCLLAAVLLVCLAKRDLRRGYGKGKTVLSLLLRGAGLLMLLGMLGQLAWLPQNTSKPSLLFLVDDSASMEQPDRAKQPATLTSVKLAEDYDVQTARLSEVVKNKESSPIVTTLLRELPADCSVALVWTDGVDTTNRSLTELPDWLDATPTKLFFVAGETDAKPSRRLTFSSVQHPQYARIGDPFAITASLRTPTHKLEQRLTVVLSEELPEGVRKEIARKDVTLAAENSEVQTTFEHRLQEKLPAAPKFVLEAFFQGEKEKVTRRFQVRATAEKMKVLLVDQTPRWEFRYLWNLLHREDSVEVTTVLLSADAGWTSSAATPGEQRLTPLLPTSLDGYDVVILGDVNPTLLGDEWMERLATHLDPPNDAPKSCALVLIAGPNFLPWKLPKTPLGKFLPIETKSLVASSLSQQKAATLKLTDAGRCFPPFLATRMDTKKLPPLYGSLGELTTRANTTTLAKLGNAPAVTFSRVGRTLVFSHLFDSSWLWRKENLENYTSYWKSLLWHLTLEKIGRETEHVGELFSDAREYDFGSAVYFSVRLAGETTQAPVVEITSPSQNPQRVILSRENATSNLWTGLAEVLPSGKWTATIQNSQSKVTFFVRKPSDEFRYSPIAEKEMRLAAQSAGGDLCFWEEKKGPKAANSEVQKLLKTLKNEAEIAKRASLAREKGRPLWNRLWFLLMTLCPLALDWMLRKL